MCICGGRSNEGGLIRGNGQYLRVCGRAPGLERGNPVEQAPHHSLAGSETMSDRPFVPLVQLVPGVRAIVRDIQGGADFSGRLAGMGLAKGTYLEILQNTGRGPVLLRTHGTRIALGRGEALKILVEETRDEPAA
jgi:ferrous iron transport protein A